MRYGGNTTCVELRLDDGTLVVLDAGSVIRLLGRHLATVGSDRELVLYLTHAHWDHLLGFPFFAPAYLPDFEIRVRGGPRAKSSLMQYLDQQMTEPYFPVPFEALKATFDFHAGTPIPRTVGSCDVEPIPLNHPNGGYGFRFREAGRTFVFLPDNELDFAHDGGLTRAEYVRECRGADVLFHDAQYTQEEYAARAGWGHTPADAAVDLALEAGVRRLGLFHHDPTHSDDDVERIEERCRSRADRAGTRLDCFAVREGMSLDL